MIRPCDNCGGTGLAHGEGLPYVGARCERCIDMPWLPRNYANPWAINDVGSFKDLPDWWKAGDPFKPDPDTMMRWCQVHESPATCDLKACWLALTLIDLLGECEIVWIERPTPLEVKDE